MMAQLFSTENQQYSLLAEGGNMISRHAIYWLIILMPAVKKHYRQLLKLSVEVTIQK